MRSDDTVCSHKGFHRQTQLQRAHGLQAQWTRLPPPTCMRGSSHTSPCLARAAARTRTLRVSPSLPVLKPSPRDLCPNFLEYSGAARSAVAFLCDMDRGYNRPAYSSVLGIHCLRYEESDQARWRRTARQPGRWRSTRLALQRPLPALASGSSCRMQMWSGSETPQTTAPRERPFKCLNVWSLCTPGDAHVGTRYVCKFLACALLSEVWTRSACSIGTSVYFSCSAVAI